MGYLVVLEKAEKNWAAYSAEVTGCVAAGRSPEETLKRYEKALPIHLEGLQEDGLPVPVARVVTMEL